MDFTGKYYELCILIPCYNNAAGLKKSIQSIKYNSSKYLILIVDDGSNELLNRESLSTDAEVVSSIHIIRLLVNKGITIALNTGLQWITDTIKCDYVARLDCGDICDSRRFYKQIDFLRENTYISLLGSWCYFSDSKKNIKFKYKAPLMHDAIKKRLYFKNVFIHPTIVVRYSVIAEVGMYPEQYDHAEDYAWFWKIANHTKTAILPFYLVICEFNTEGISYTNRSKQLNSRMAIVKEFGHNFVFKYLAIIKIWFLMKIPYSVIINIKRAISF